MKPLFTAAVLALSTLPAFAQDDVVCMATEEMEASLVDWYDETPAVMDEDGTIVWASGIGGTWTVVSYNDNGTSCALAQGDNWSPRMNADALMAGLLNEQGTSGS
ncbi:hypothetical protein BDE40_2562 [Litoreibacter halocynthiae]|uniref:S-adenosyl-L-homocysteine hydrolase n=1 Tax=Litoreibacter halocynthiae TaxID=1242689 RepID=A0A4R7LH17_9RHOB|nr:S-adenosyl-L-homocysteine hydrolase [Litoreibacter halocynthiae]TDT73786.1 hypothetical protein BDE40_2562 [Litoreibacter halocynthiae]